MSAFPDGGTSKKIGQAAGLRLPPNDAKKAAGIAFDNSWTGKRGDTEIVVAIK